jgi:hypothetical protein
MNDEETLPGEMTLNIKGLKKRIVPFEEGDPQTEPLFINYVHGAFVGGSGYLDVGVIPLEAFESPEANVNGIADFAVLTRLVMSKATLILIRDQINDLLTRTDKNHAIKEQAEKG